MIKPARHKSLRPRRGVVLALIGVAGLAAVLTLLIAIAIGTRRADHEDRKRNGVFFPPPYPVSKIARAFHDTLIVADLHADTLLWSRDLLKRNSFGHVDFPRLTEGGVGIQVFSAVTRFPRDIGAQNSETGRDAIQALAIAQRWPVKTWNSVLARALYQAHKLKEFEKLSKGKFTILRTREDVDRFVARRRSDPRAIAGLLAIEGAHALEGRLENVDVLFDAGYRMISLAHYQNSEMGGAAHGVGNIGLTPLGREMVRRMEAKGIILDLSHASPRTFAEGAAFARRPVVVSHGGVRAVYDNPRNITDAEIRAVAKTGGIIGAGFWRTASGGQTTANIVRTIHHIVKVAGPQTAALGSDFDGAVATPFDATGVAQLTEALGDSGLGRKEIAQIMGGNVLRLLREILPSENATGTRP